jgi:hypothetical protein
LLGGEEEKDKDVVRFRVDKFSIIYEHIIPFFGNNALQSSKSKDNPPAFARVDFCKASKIINNKSHLNEKGLEELKQIKSGMNSGRVH